ncbi:MAG: hypothetical protein Q4G45_10485 [Actinomycetia bacterium]|nr:hypothetical protein [Actinomycetes bacterium]
MDHHTAAAESTTRWIAVPAGVVVFYLASLASSAWTQGFVTFQSTVLSAAVLVVLAVASVAGATVCPRAGLLGALAAAATVAAGHLAGAADGRQTVHSWTDAAAVWQHGSGSLPVVLLVCAAAAVSLVCALRSPARSGATKAQAESLV